MSLYEKHNYLNKDIEYLIGREIIEYDIQSAGFNICKRYGLLDERRLAHLESLDKKRRQITIGLYQQQSQDFKDELNAKFVEVRKEFFEANQLQDEDVLSIKKDAIITLRRCHNVRFNNIVFSDKHVYTSYFYLNKLEFYVNDRDIHVKGISDDKLRLHMNYMLDFLHKIFRLMQTNPNKRYIIDSLTQFASFYKRGELHIGYYRELNTDSLYKLNRSFMQDFIGLHDVDSLDGIDISYNYMQYVVPIINILL